MAKKTCATSKSPTVEILATGDLIPYVRNSRNHSEAQIAQIAGSIREFGFTNPILIDGDNGVIAGHGRMLAAQKLGITTVPCIRLDHLTETQKRAYVIADNKLALNAGWDEELLGLELADLREADFDLGLIGFDANEIENVLNPAEMPDDRTDKKIFSTYEVIAECSDESQQKEIYDLIKKKGVSCRLATL